MFFVIALTDLTGKRPIFWGGLEPTARITEAQIYNDRSVAVAAAKRLPAIADVFELQLQIGQHVERAQASAPVPTLAELSA